MMWGEKGADLGSGRGPWTEHVSFSPDVDNDARSGRENGCREGSSSRYADPEAEGVIPVLRTSHSLLVQLSQYVIYNFYLHIFLRTFAGLDLIDLSARSFESLVR